MIIFKHEANSEIFNIESVVGIEVTIETLRVSLISGEAYQVVFPDDKIFMIDHLHGTPTELKTTSEAAAHFAQHLNGDGRLAVAESVKKIIEA